MSPEYLAGFFDGEGTFWLGEQTGKNGLQYGAFNVLLSQSGDDGLALLEQIQKEYGGKIYQHLRPGQYKATKSAYKLYWSRKEGIELIKILLPFLILKQEQAQKVLQYLERENIGKHRKVQNTVRREHFSSEVRAGA